jgi:hypothetical protein
MRSLFTVFALTILSSTPATSSDAAATPSDGSTLSTEIVAASGPAVSVYDCTGGVCRWRPVSTSYSTASGHAAFRGRVVLAAPVRVVERSVVTVRRVLSVRPVRRVFAWRPLRGLCRRGGCG